MSSEPICFMYQYIHDLSGICWLSWSSPKWISRRLFLFFCARQNKFCDAFNAYFFWQVYFIYCKYSLNAKWIMLTNSVNKDVNAWWFDSKHSSISIRSNCRWWWVFTKCSDFVPVNGLCDYILHVILPRSNSCWTLSANLSLKSGSYLLRFLKTIHRVLIYGCNKSQEVKLPLLTDEFTDKLTRERVNFFGDMMQKYSVSHQTDWPA